MAICLSSIKPRLVDIMSCTASPGTHLVWGMSMLGVVLYCCTRPFSLKCYFYVIPVIWIPKINLVLRMASSFFWPSFLASLFRVNSDNCFFRKVLSRWMIYRFADCLLIIFDNLVINLLYSVSDDCLETVCSKRESELLKGLRMAERVNYNLH